jgi:hypothetical protein
MYRVLAIFWLVAGAAWIIYDNYGGGNGVWIIPGLGWSPGWVCLLLAVYNLLRWWSRRVGRSGFEAEYRARLQRRDYLRNPPPVRREPPDPNFIFTDEPPPAPTDEGKPGQKPPTEL